MGIMGQVGLMRQGARGTVRRTVRGVERLCVAALVLALGACTLSGLGDGPVTSGARAQDAEMDSAERTLWASGVEAESAHNYEQATNAFANLHNRRPNDIKVFTAFLRNMRYSGRAMEAVNYTQQHAMHFLGDVAVKFEYGKSQLDAGMKADALNTLRDVASAMPNNWQVHSAIGIAFDSVSRFDDAIAAYRTALTLTPDNSIVMNNLAISQAMAGKLQDAINTLERAAAVDRTNTHVRQNLALLYAANGESEKAAALAAMDLESGDLEKNLSFYRRFGGGQP